MIVQRILLLNNNYVIMITTIQAGLCLHVLECCASVISLQISQNLIVAASRGVKVWEFKPLLNPNTQTISLEPNSLSLTPLSPSPPLGDTPSNSPGSRDSASSIANNLHNSNNISNELVWCIYINGEVLYTASNDGTVKSWDIKVRKG